VLLSVYLWNWIVSLSSADSPGAGSPEIQAVMERGAGAPLPRGWRQSGEKGNVSPILRFSFGAGQPEVRPCSSHSLRELSPLA
jgi:hypothetical protein